MKRSKYTEQQIIFALRQAETGVIGSGSVPEDGDSEIQRPSTDGAIANPPLWVRARNSSRRVRLEWRSAAFEMDSCELQRWL